jgi:anti-sigma regulatory factor (Ser/Thr protein kinase)
MSGDAPIRQFLKFQAVPSTARPARRFVADTLRAQGATSDEIVDIALVASELVSNIIEHGDGLELSLGLSATPETWELSVVGGRCSPESLVLRPEKWNVAGADESSGRGLGIVRQLMDDISVDATDGTVSVNCRRRRAPL